MTTHITADYADLQEEQVIVAVIGDHPDLGWHLRPGGPMRAAMRGEIPRDCMAWPERKAAALGRAGRRGAGTLGT